MSVVETVGGRLYDFLWESQSHQADTRTLYYRVELTDSANKTRAEYNDRAKALHSNLTSKLTESGHFVDLHLDRTIDPYIALGMSQPNLSLSNLDERIYDLAEKEKQRHPWPEGTEFDINELLAGFPTPRASQSARKNIVTYEVTARGTYGDRSEWGSPAALENARRLTTEFETETDDVEEIERFRPVPDGWYAFRRHNHEIRVRATAKAERPYVEWQVGYTDECPRGLAWAGVANDDEYGRANGRLHLDKHSNESEQVYFEDHIHSIPMPKRIAESLLEDARTVEPERPY